MKNSSSVLYFNMLSSEIEESNHVSKTLSSPCHFFFGKSATVPWDFFVSAFITSDSFGGLCLHGST